MKKTKAKKMGKWYGEVDKNRKQLMVENQLIVDSYLVDSSTSKPTTKKPSTRKPATSNHPAFALLLLGALLLLLAFLPPAALAQGTPITTCAELQNIRNDVTGDYYLANDINCSGFDYAGDGKGFMPIGTLSSKFTGTFDGKGYKITHLYINRPSPQYVSLFVYTRSGSEIKNVGLEEVDVRGNQQVGGLGRTESKREIFRNP